MHTSQLALVGSTRVRVGVVEGASTVKHFSDKIAKHDRQIGAGKTTA